MQTCEASLNIGECGTCNFESPCCTRSTACITRGSQRAIENGLRFLMVLKVVSCLRKLFPDDLLLTVIARNCHSVQAHFLPSISSKIDKR